MLKGAIHLQDLLLREDIDVHLRRLRLKAVVSYSSLHMSAMTLVLDNLQWLSPPPPTTLAPINKNLLCEKLLKLIKLVTGSN